MKHLICIIITISVVKITNQEFSCKDDNKFCLTHQSTEELEERDDSNDITAKIDDENKNVKSSHHSLLYKTLSGEEERTTQKRKDLILEFYELTNESSRNYLVNTSQNESNSEIEMLNETAIDMSDNLNEEQTTIEVPESAVTEPSSSSTSSSTSTSTSTTLSTPTTTLPPENLFNETTQRNGICLCDLKIDECDVNCCCDEECSSIQRQAFSKCEDIKLEHDPNHCYKTKFIYENNTKHKIVMNEHRLFCIVKDNLPSRLNFKTKPVITTLEEFNKNIAKKKIFAFNHDRRKQPSMSAEAYHSGHLIWSFQNGKLTPFKVPASNIGSSCTSERNVRFLEDFTTECSRPAPFERKDCEISNGLDMTYYVRDKQVIMSPALINKTTEKMCQNETCIEITPHICTSFQSISDCRNGTDQPKFSDGECKKVVTEVEYYFYHNGTDGIKQAKAYFWLKNMTGSFGHQMLQKISVKFRWVDSPEIIFERSGNPGYIVGKPVMAGRKIYNVSTENAAVKKEAIELSVDSNQWLTAFGMSQGICSSEFRNPIRFRENALYTCSLHLMKDDFDKGKCLQLQKRIFDLLIGEDFSNITTNNHFNKFVATFGNSKVEETGDWVQVLVDLFPVISSQVSFKSHSNSIVCKNVITGMYVEIAHSNVGSFTNPQAKILGVSFRFGQPEDLIMKCGVSGCKSSSVILSYKIFTSIHFIDLTEPAVKKFAEPPGLEAKLPHDFFYPFFSKSSTLCFPNITLFCTFILLNIFANMHQCGLCALFFLK